MIRLLIFVCFIIPNILFGQGINNGLILYYPFTGNCIDQSGNRFDGFPNATLTEDRFGNPNSAYHFNGIDEFIDIPHHPELKPDFPFSFSFWVKFEVLPNSKSTLFTTDYVENIYSGSWMTLVEDGKINFSFGDLGRTTSSSSKHSAAKIKLNLWHHIATIVKGPNDIEIFLDCINAGGEYSGSGGSLTYTKAPMSIGRVDGSNHLPTYYFQGSLDEFRYYNRALTPAEIDTLCGYVTTNTNQLKEKDCEFNVFPNPASNVINIRGEIAPDYKIQIFDALGRLVTLKPYAEQVDVSSFPPGMYYIKTCGQYGNGRFMKFAVSH